MMHSHYMKTVMGGLSLVLLLSACSSGAKSKKADARARSSSDVVADRGNSNDPMDRMTTQNQMATERQVPHDRLGTGGDKREADRVVPCADDKGDVTGSMDCDRMNRKANYRDGGLAAACTSRVDAQGQHVYDDPACPDRYYNERAAYDRSGGAATCASRTDAKGNVIYDDPACPARYRGQMGSSFENVTWTQESAFYDRYTDKAAKYSRQAEVAANQGHAPEMLRHAELALDQAKEAQRVGHQPDLDAGIVALREAITFGHGNQIPAAASSVRDARVKLSRAAGIPAIDTRPRGTPATQASAQRTRTVRGELVPDQRSAATAGGQRFLLRDPQNRDTPIALSDEMSRQVKAGDHVEAQLDSKGDVVGISKYE